MSLLKKIETPAGAADETDRLGGNSFVRESGAYDFIIDVAYLTASPGGAAALNLSLKDKHGKFSIQQYFTSSADKGGKNYYTKDGENHYLPGYNNANAVCLLTVEKELAAMETEERQVPIYNYDAKAEVPTKVEVLTELTGQPITIGLIKQLVDVKKKGADGKYYATGDTRFQNEVDKIFHTGTKMTIAEARTGEGKAEFYDKWVEANAGKVKDKSTKTGATGGAPKAASAGPAKPKAGSLFGPK